MSRTIHYNHLGYPEFSASVHSIGLNHPVLADPDQYARQQPSFILDSAAKYTEPGRLISCDISCRTKLASKLCYYKSWEISSKYPTVPDLQLPEPWRQSTHARSFASQRRQHSRVSHRQCFPQVAVRVSHRPLRSAGTALLMLYCAYPIWKLWKPAQQLPAVDLLCKPHTGAGQHASAGHTPAIKETFTS